MVTTGVLVTVVVVNAVEVDGTVADAVFHQ
jgi:hypothetical protein